MRFLSVGAGISVLVLASLGLVPAERAAHGQEIGEAATAATAPWRNIGPPGGFVESVAVDPRSPSTVYVGVNNGGVFKSVDSASTWASSGVPGVEIRTLEVDPTNDMVVYAGSPFGLYITRSGGTTWRYNNPLGFVQVNALAVDPSNGSIVYVATQSGGVYKSTNGGTTWSTVNSGLTASQINDVVMAPTSASTLYAATPSGVFRTTNSGGSWSAVETGLSNTDIQSVAVSTASAHSVWAMTAPSFGGVEGFHSSNSGTSWSSDSSGLPGPASTLFGLENVPLLVTSASIYAGIPGFGLFEEPTSASTWTSTNSGMTDPDGLATQRVFALAADPANTSDLYAGTRDGGLFDSTDAGGSWAPQNTGLLGNGVYAVAGNPSNQNVIYAGTANLGLFLSSDGGNTWASATEVGGALINTIVVDPVHPATVWAGGAGIFKTTDNGQQWTGNTGGEAGLPAILSVTGIAVDPFNSKTLWITILGQGVYKTTNGGTSWSAVNSGLTDLSDLAIAADPSKAGLLYVGTESSGVFTSTNGGISWTQLTTTGLPSVTINSIVDGQLGVGTSSSVSFYTTGKWQNASIFLKDGTQGTGTDCHIKLKVTGLKVPDYGILCNEGLFWSIDGGASFRQLDYPSGYQGAVAGFAGDPLFLVGTFGDGILALPSYAPIFTASSSSNSVTGSATATVPPGQTPGASGTLSATASTGTGKVTVNVYFGDPSRVKTPTETGGFFGATLSSTNSFQTVTINDCQLADSSTTVYWRNGSTWVAASNQTFDSSSGCVTIIVNGTTTPSLAELKGAYFANIG